MMGIYAIVNKINGKKYIGLTRSLKMRWYKHRAKLRAGIHPNQHLQGAWNKYGENNFEFITLEITEDVSKLSELEKLYIAQYDSYTNGYNKTIGGEEAAGFEGKHHKEETLQIMSQAASQRWQDSEYRERNLTKRQEVLNSEECRAKMSATSRGENNGHSKITEQDATKIKLHYLRSNNKYGVLKELTQMYPMLYKGAIIKIYTGRTWKHLPNTVEELEHMLINYQR